MMADDLRQIELAMELVGREEVNLLIRITVGVCPPAERHRAIALLQAKPAGTPRNVWRGPIDEIDVEGPIARIRVGTVPPVIAEVTTAAVEALRLAPGQDVWVTIKATEIALYPG